MTHPAIEFLKHLDESPEATFNIEHYTDVSKGATKPIADPLSGRYANQTLQQVATLLTKLQEVNEKGAGIFVARNQCNGHRSEANVTRVRGIHADMDDVTDAQLLSITTRLHPTIIVHSSSGRQQLYWQLADGEILEKEEAKAINQCLSRLGADPAAVDVSRLLRLPGFMHMKYRGEGKTPTVIAEYPGVTYTSEQIRTAFPPVPAVASHANTLTVSARNIVGVDDKLSNRLALLAATLETTYPDLWDGNWKTALRSTGEIGYPSQSEADLALAGHITRACTGEGVDEDLLGTVIEMLFSRSGAGQSDKWKSRPDYRDRTISKAIAGSLPSFTPSSVGLQLDSHGDVRNAKAFAELARGAFKYVATRSAWIKWKSDRWSLAELDEHVAMAKDVCAQMLAAAGAIFAKDQARGKRLLQDAVVAHNLPRITAMLKLAISEPDMATTDRELDGNPYLLGIANGVVDLKTGHHMFNHPEYLITRYCSAAYDQKANCDRWIQFLFEVFDGEADTVGCVQRLLGCTLIGLANEEKLIICYGHGSNGKSVFSNVVHKIMGGYAITAPPSLLTVRRADDTGPRNDIAALAGARYVSINEMQAGDRLDEQVVKVLAGREPISARFLHQEFFEFVPAFTPWLRTNHKPIITGDDDGIWRRLVLLKFGRQFAGDEVNPNLEQELLRERDGILMWMIEGAKLYLQNGICMSRSMVADLATYRRESDLLGEFLADKTVADPDGKVSQGTLYLAYRLWCQDCGVRTMSKKSFTQRLAERGYSEGKSGNNRYYVGLTQLSGLFTETQAAVDRLDSFEGISAKSPHENLTLEKYPNSLISRPSCPAPTVKE